METPTNSLYCKASKKPFRFNVFLGDKNIAEINTIGKGTLIIYKKERHIFRKLNAIGLNYELLVSPVIHYRLIVIYLQRNNLDKPEFLYTDREYFLNKGKIFEFKKANCEKQVFLPLNLFGIEKVKEYHRLQPNQESLFEPIYNV
jgi:hypothetical protein